MIEPVVSVRRVTGFGPYLGLWLVTLNGSDVTWPPCGKYDAAQASGGILKRARELVRMGMGWEDVLRQCGHEFSARVLDEVV